MKYLFLILGLVLIFYASRITISCKDDIPEKITHLGHEYIRLRWPSYNGLVVVHDPECKKCCQRKQD